MPSHLQETQQRKQRLAQFLALQNLTSSTADDAAETLRKKRVFAATQNKQRQEAEMKADLDRYMKRVDASKLKIQKDLELRLRRKRLEKLKALKKLKSSKTPKSTKSTKSKSTESTKSKSLQNTPSTVNSNGASSEQTESTAPNPATDPPTESIPNPAVDPLDAFMSTLNAKTPPSGPPGDDTLNGSDSAATSKLKRVRRTKGERIYSDESKFDEGDLEIEDEFDFGAPSDSRNRSKELVAVDPAQRERVPLRKDLYVESPEIGRLSESEVALIRSELLGGCKVTMSGGAADIRPVLKWTQCGLPEAVLSSLQRLEMARPFPVQSAVIPLAMSGRDLICVSPTGSGKTLAYILPLIRHVLAVKADGFLAEGLPSAMVLCPTRELAQQIVAEAKSMVRRLDGEVTVCSVYGGAAISEQIKAVKRGRCRDVVVATPGRLIDLLCTNSGRLLDIWTVSYFVLDEADRLFDLGFGAQIHSILGQIRGDATVLLNDCVCSWGGLSVIVFLPDFVGLLVNFFTKNEHIGDQNHNMIKHSFLQPQLPLSNVSNVIFKSSGCCSSAHFVNLLWHLLRLLFWAFVSSVKWLTLKHSLEPHR